MDNQSSAAVEKFEGQKKNLALLGVHNVHEGENGELCIGGGERGIREGTKQRTSEMDRVKREASEERKSKKTGFYTGWLTKRGKIVKNWKRRFCVLEDGILKYFKDDPQNSFIKPRGQIQVRGNKLNRAYFPKKKAEGFEIETKKRVWQLFADTQQEWEAWKDHMVLSGAAWNNGIHCTLYACVYAAWLGH
jgi:hypothetical protein